MYSGASILASFVTDMGTEHGYRLLSIICCQNILIGNKENLMLGHDCLDRFRFL